MKEHAFVIGLVVLVGCSSAGGTSTPTSCKQGDRIGTYKLTLVEQSGNCGPVDSQLVSFNTGPNGAGTGCAVNSERWSEGDCKLERDVTCGNVRTVMVSRAQTANASELSGTASFTITGSNPCSGTYAVDLLRQ